LARRGARHRRGTLACEGRRKGGRNLRRRATNLGEKRASAVNWIGAICAAFALITLPPALAEESRGIRIVAANEGSSALTDIPLYNKVYAVVIGIDEYPGLAPDLQLTYAVSDARAVERLLESKFVFEKVYSLYDEQATQGKILDLLLNKLSDLEEDDAVFIFFAGHGGQEVTEFGPIGFLVPHDGDFEDGRKVISMTTIRDDISKRIKAKHVFYVMDACYGGILLAERGAEVQTGRSIEYLRQIAKEPVRQVLTAGSADERVLDGGPRGHSVFTGRLLEVLDEADDFITASEVSERVKERVFADAHARGHTQTPKSGTLFGLGDFVFMPSMTKKLGSMESQIAVLEAELEGLRDAEASTARARDDAAQREVERRARVAEAKLKAKRLEQERLAQEQQRIATREADRARKSRELKLRQEEEAARLALLREEVESKRSHYGTSMVSSLDEALREMQALEGEILAIRGRFREELESQIMAIARAHSDTYRDVTLEKDEFETESEYQARLARSAAGGMGDNKLRYRVATGRLKSEYDAQVATLIAQMEVIAGTSFTVYGHDALVIALGRFDAEREHFPITIASRNIAHPVHPRSCFLFVTKAEGQLRRVGGRAGDMILRYNGQEVRPDTNWDRLKQTVLGESVTMEVERAGQPITLHLKKGRIGLRSQTDDWAAKLEPDQFIVSGRITVPRTEARQFKQNFLNGFVTAELEVAARTPRMSLVSAALVVDESTDRRFDLFQAPYLYFGHSLVYDKASGIYWVSRALGQRTYEGARRFLERYQHGGLTGWELPTLVGLQNLRNPLALWRKNFDASSLYTRTIARNGKHHYQYCPTSDRKDSRDSETETVVATARILDLPHYALDFDRYLLVDPNLVFDLSTMLLWLVESSPREYTYLEAVSFAKSLEYQGLRGWRLPELEEIGALWDPSIPGVDQRLERKLDRTFYTGTRSEHSSSHLQYNPASNRADSGDSETEWVIGVM